MTRTGLSSIAKQQTSLYLSQHRFVPTLVFVLPFDRMEIFNNDDCDNENSNTEYFNDVHFVFTH